MGITKQRRAILEILSGKGKHMTVDQIFEQAKKTLPHLGKGTVYRNLNLLADEGMIKRLHIPGQPSFFDGNAHPHQHMVCLTCGRVDDVDSLDSACLRALAGPHTAVISHTLTVYVVCKACSSQIHTGED